MWQVGPTTVSIMVGVVGNYDFQSGHTWSRTLGLPGSNVHEHRPASPQNSKVTMAGHTNTF